MEAQFVSGYAFGLYRGRWRFGSFDEVASLAKAALLTTVLIVSLDLALVSRRSIPLSSAVAAGPLALVLMAGARYAWRLRLELRRRPTGADGTRLLVFGAGEGGAQVITAMLRDPDSPYYPVGLLDDDPEKKNLRIMGVPVVGDRSKLVEAAERYRADALLVAVPSADAELLAEVADLAAEADLAVKVLPPVKDLFGGGVGLF
jgi:FlaA1/EpsC-like NDP-sugar epimerase